MDIKDFKVGQNAFVRLTGNAGKGKSGDELIEEWEVISVGRKLIKAKRMGWSDVCAITFEKREKEKSIVVGTPHQKNKTYLQRSYCHEHVTILEF